MLVKATVLLEISTWFPTDRTGRATQLYCICSKVLACKHEYLSMHAEHAIHLLNELAANGGNIWADTVKMGSGFSTAVRFWVRLELHCPVALPGTTR